MPSRERDGLREPRASHAPGVTGEYSKARRAGHRELAAAFEGALALCKSAEKCDAADAALALLTSAQGLGFRRAACLLLDPTGTTLAGAGAARRARSSAGDSRFAGLVRALRLSTADAAQNPKP